MSSGENYRAGLSTAFRAWRQRQKEGKWVLVLGLAAIEPSLRVLADNFELPMMNTGQDAPFTGSQDGRRYKAVHFCSGIPNRLLGLVWSAETQLLSQLPFN